MKWKGWVYAATALATAAGLYLYLKSPAPPNGLTIVQIIKRSTYKSLTTQMRVYFKENYQKELINYRKTRRLLLSRSAEYEKCVQDFNKRVQDLVEEAQVLVLTRFGLSKKHFQDSVNYFDLDPELQSCAGEMVDPTIQVESGQILGKEETKKILDFYQARLKEYESECPELEEYMIINVQIEDEIYRKFKVELEVLNASWEVYKEEFQDLYEQLRNQTYCVMASTDNSY